MAFGLDRDVILSQISTTFNYIQLHVFQNVVENVVQLHFNYIVAKKESMACFRPTRAGRPVFGAPRPGRLFI